METITLTGSGRAEPELRVMLQKWGAARARPAGDPGGVRRARAGRRMVESPSWHARQHPSPTTCAR